jgi:tRNA 2-thiouridine synthesizing protein C
MYVNRRAPYGSVYALESLEVVLVGAAFDQDVSVVFADDGVFQLKKGQDTKELGMKNFSPTYRALEMYDVEKLYVEKESLEARGLTEEDLVVPVEVMSSSEIGKLMEQQDVVLSF